MRHSLRETWSGLRRNLTMTLAVIITMWVSLTLFGVSLMINQEVNIAKDRWYDKIEISVFLCVADMAGGPCTPGQDTTDAQREQIRTALEANPEVEKVYYETKKEAYESFKKTYENDPALVSTLTEEQMQDSFRIKLKNPENYEGVVQEAKALQGVQNVQDLQSVLDPIFKGMNAIKWGTMGLSIVLLLAAGLQIGNTIRLSAFTRRKEIGIMRLVGASNSYILMPFLLEALIASIAGIALACGSMAAVQTVIVNQNLKPLIHTLSWISWPETGFAMGGVAVIGVALAIIPTLLATRKYLRV